MKIKKSSNGNVVFLSKTGKVLKSFSPSSSIAISGGTGTIIRIEDGSNGGTILNVSKVTALIKGVVETPFSGDGNALMIELSDNFFFDKTQTVV